MTWPKDLLKAALCTLIMASPFFVLSYLWSQTTAPLTCEQALASQYDQLSADPAPVIPRMQPPPTSWAEYLHALVSELRVAKTQYDIRNGQAQIVERNLAVVAERNRLLQERVTRLEQDLAATQKKPE
jgi:hypothetical protein